MELIEFYKQVIHSQIFYGMMAVFVCMVVSGINSLFSTTSEEKKITKTLNSDLDILNSFEYYIAVFGRGSRSTGVNKNIIELYTKTHFKDGVDIDGADHFSIRIGDIPYKIHNNLGLSSLEFAKRAKERFDVKYDEGAGADDKLFTNLFL